ncbi:MAG: MATE family efflux transporter [Lachnospiraceae bacterium]|nr:MATE family efflux transporter [Lachnospiraceae bacterium]
MEEKKQKRFDFTKGEILKPMILFTLPVLLGDVFSALYNVVDSLVVGRFVGSNALAAVSASFAITMVTVAVYAGFGMGSSVVMGQLFGAKRMDDLAKGISTAILGAVIVGLSMTVVGLIISKPLLSLINTPAEIMPGATIYLRIYMLGCMTQLMYFMSSGIMRALGDSKHPMYYLIVCSIINIVLDIVFVAVFHWNEAGVAAATVIAQAVSAVLGIHRILTGFGIKISRDKFRIHGSILKLILKIGVPAAVQQSINSVGMLFIQSFSNSFGAALVASNGIMQKLDGFAQLPVMALGTTVTTFNSQNIGAGEKERAQQGNRKMMIVVIGVCVVVGVLLFTFCGSLYKLFLNPADPNYDLVVEMGMRSVRIVSMFYWAFGLQMMFVSVLRGLGATIPTMIISICFTILRVPVTKFMAKPGTPAADYTMLYWAQSLFFVLMFLAMFLYYKFGNWEKYSVVRRQGKTGKEDI